MPKHILTPEDGAKGGRKSRKQGLKTFRQYLIDAGEEGQDQLRRVGKALLDRAESGDPAAIKLVLSYTEGLPKQDLDITSGGQPINITFTPADGG